MEATSAFSSLPLHHQNGRGTDGNGKSSGGRGGGSSKRGRMQEEFDSPGRLMTADVTDLIG